MFERILLPLDGSPLAEAVLSHLAPVLKKPGIEALLVRVVWPPLADHFDYDLVLSKLERSAEEYLEMIAGGLRRAEIRASSVVRVGPPAEMILDAAVTHRATLIAMSTHGMTRAQRRRPLPERTARAA